MKYYLPDMELFNARLRPVVKTPDVAPSSKLRKAMSGKPGGFVRQAGNAGIAAIAVNDESSTDERLFGFPFPAFSAFPALTTF
jgi:hypothetical protein